MSLPSTTVDTSSKPAVKRREAASTGNTSPPRPISLGEVATDEFPPFIVKFNGSTLDPEIETLYGPFEDPPSWAFPQVNPVKQKPVVKTPSTTSNPDDISLQISKLKALIQEREKLTTKRPTYFNQAPIAQHTPTSHSVESNSKNSSTINGNHSDTSNPLVVHKTPTALAVQHASKTKQNTVESKEPLEKALPQTAVQLTKKHLGQTSSSRSSDHPTTLKKSTEKRHEGNEASIQQSQRQQLNLNGGVSGKQSNVDPASSRPERMKKPVVELIDSDSDTDMGTDDPDFEKYIQEQRKYDNLLDDIRSKVEKAKKEVDSMTIEKRRLQRYLKVIPTTLTLLSPSTSTSSSSAGTRRKMPVSDNTESSNRSQKRQKRSKASTFGDTYANVVASGLPASAPPLRVNSPFQHQQSAPPSQPLQLKSFSITPSVTDYYEYLTELANYVRNRAIDKDVLNQLPNYGTVPPVEVKSSPQVQQLITLDNITFTSDSFRLPEASKYIAVDTTQFKPTRYHESILLALVIDGIPRPNVLPNKTVESLSLVLAQAPAHFKDFLINYKHGDICDGLDPMINAIREAITLHGNMELLWVTYMELMIYQHGNSDQVGSSFLTAYQYHPFSLELFWQVIFSASDYTARSALTTELLKSISASRSNASCNVTPETLSEKTTEVLLRTLRFDGVRGALDQLLPGTLPNLHDAGRLIQLSLKTTPSHVFINDHDLCFIWLSIITYYVFERLPNDLNRQHWFERVNHSGGLKPSPNPLFVMDWPKSEVKLDPIHRTVVVTILLDMFSYVIKKVRSDASKKDLVVTVWRNIISLLETLDCYGRAGTLALLRQNLDVAYKFKPIRGELLDIVFDLERRIPGDKKSSNSMWKLFEDSTITEDFPMVLFVSYKAATLLEPTKEMSNGGLVEVAWRLSRPLLNIYDPHTMKKLNFVKDRESALINYLCGLYSSALGITDTFEILQAPNFSTIQFRKMPIAWIIAVYLHLIHYWMTNDFIFMDSFLKEVSLPFILEGIDSKDGRTLYHRFKKDCVTLLMKK